MCEVGSLIARLNVSSIPFIHFHDNQGSTSWLYGQDLQVGFWKLFPSPLEWTSKQTFGLWVSCLPLPRAPVITQLNSTIQDHLPTSSSLSHLQDLFGHGKSHTHRFQKKGRTIWHSMLHYHHKILKLFPSSHLMSSEPQDVGQTKVGPVKAKRI